jgi:hypothetical protein
MPSTPPVPPADALLAALERYALHIAQLTARWKDAELYNRVAQDVDAVRLACQVHPDLNSAWVGLLISHAELMHALWQAPGTLPDPGAAERQRLLRKVQGDARALQDMGMRLVGRC